MEVWRSVSKVLHDLVGDHNVVGWQVVLAYMSTPPTHYYLESSVQVAYVETQA